jgi:hypothetical protein
MNPAGNFRLLELVARAPGLLSQQQLVAVGGAGRF